MINEQQAIDLVNADIRKKNRDPIYRVYKVTTYEWGWSMSWMPKDNSKILYGTSDYTVHKNGFMSTFLDILWDHGRHPTTEGHNIIELFIKEATRGK